MFHSDLPESAQIVIIGAGIVGASVAYHLTKLGCTDVVVLEKGTLASGTTGHGAGLVTQLRHTRALTDISRYAVDLYGKLEEETGQASGFRQTGSITVALKPERWDELKRAISMAKGFGVQIESITPQEAGQMWPLMRVDDIVGAIYIPKDGQTVPDTTTMAMAVGATNRGAAIIENVRVTAISQKRGAVTSISTNRGSLSCEIVINCAGMWAREIGLLCGVNVPLHAADHAYLVTAPIEGIPTSLPSLRDPDGYIYLRTDLEDRGGLLVGGFEPVARPWGMEGIPDDFAVHMLNRDWSHYNIFIEKALERVPTLENTEILRFLVGPESFTPDNHYIVGEAPELKNFFVAAGFNSSGIAAAAGAGKALAEWIVETRPTVDLSEVDIRRFHQFQNSPTHLHDRTVENLGLLYATHWPHRQMLTARDVRRSPLHDRLAMEGACFGATAGWERANWFAPKGVSPQYQYSFGRQNWFKHSRDEHRAVRERVGLFDLTSFAKFLVVGRDAGSVLQSLCANDVGVPPGRVVYTSMLNEHGGIEADLTVTRIAKDSYFIVTSGTSATRDAHWIRIHIPDKADAALTDVTSAYAVLGVMGPMARELIAGLTDSDMSNEAFPYLTSSEIFLGSAPIRATRITYVGELGWELYIPAEFALHVYELIVAEGEKNTLQHAGFHAMDSLRIEKAYRAWGTDIVDQDTPLEAGLEFAVAFNKTSNFIGKEALLHQRSQGLRKKLAVFTINDPTPLLLGDEPIFHDGVVTGRITSGAYGHTIGRSVGLGWIESEVGSDPAILGIGGYEIEIATERFTATGSFRPQYDPEGERIRA